MPDQATTDSFTRLGISLVLGMLVGLQREQTSAALAGMRTFALITISGTLAGLLDQSVTASGWIIAAAAIGICLVIVAGQWRLSQRPNQNIETTTSVAMVLMFIVGAYLASGSRMVGVATGVAIAALLQFKPELHAIAGKLGEKDMRAIIQFAVLSFVILPVLPNKEYGPLEVFNPFNIWLMVVLIVGISLSGYIVFKFFGQNAGVVVGGILGGSISSTATSVSYAKQTRESPSMIGQATTVIAIASTIVFIRVLIELSVVAPSYLQEMGIPIAIMMGACVLASLVAWLSFRGQSEPMHEPTNPSEFKSALIFAALYVLVLWGLAAAKQYLGKETLYVIAGLSGLTDMDAITLSTGRMVQTASDMSPATGWRLIVTAAIANLVFKAAIVGFMGGRQLLLRVTALFAIPVAVGTLLILFWR